ncbi:hypothetical protein I4U23_011510 [Adineta vaga]|nr:hypothetical protein I4U23_011510 [Adineta vaga]
MLKFCILIIAQTKHLTNRSFLYSQCVSIDFILRIGLQLDQWLHACVAMERIITVTKGVKFNKIKSKAMAKYIALCLFMIIIITNIHDPFHRRLINDDDNNDENIRRIWCIAVHSSTFEKVNFYVNILHCLGPFIMNIVSAILIISITARRRTVAQSNQSYQHFLFGQLREHKHLFIASITMIILVIPRLIISFVSGCMKSMDDSEVFLAGYFISFIPSTLTFVVFVLPSKTYKDEFKQTIKRYQSRWRMYLCGNS